MTRNPRLSLHCVICKEWGQAEPHCAHGLEDGVNPGALYFTPSRALTLEIGIRAAAYLTEENRVGRAGRTFYVETLARRAA